ncbi:apoptosis-inducing factor 3 [Salminus brasiliensis]|uniref:apoptosis-inducing factor 3 n=1 Tax=Salminus brasiliensis TaxID=930266 RepID=UPI003B8395FB
MSEKEPRAAQHADPQEDEEEATAVVCMESDLKDGEMMEVDVGDHNVLLVKCDGEYSAIGNQCTHYGAPLSTGVLRGQRVRCPWHGACFNVKTGDMEEYPAMDSLRCHKVKVEDKKVYVTVNKKALGQATRLKKMGGRDPDVKHTVILLGGGCASLICAEVLRQENYGGRIIMVTRDDLLPYDKTRLSKVMNVHSSSIMLRRIDFYQKYDIEVWLKKEALTVDTEKKTVAFKDGTTECYDQLLVATGCRAKELDSPGTELENVLMLETPEDANRIHNACIGCRTVLVGTSFVGMEVASYMIDKASSITVIGFSELPYLKTLGPEIGKVTMTILEERGVKFYMNDSVAEVRGENGKVKEVVLKSGTIVVADVLIVGIGIVPNSEFLQGSAIKMDSKKYVIVDKYMRTNAKDVYCAGDLTSFPLQMVKNQSVSVAHWQVAQAHGRIAALNMLGREVTLNTVPFYWTVLLGQTIRYAGYGEGYTHLVLKGRFEDMRFLALYIKDDVVVATAGLNFEPAVSAIAERFAAGIVITRAEAESDDLSWLKLPPRKQ